MSGYPGWEGLSEADVKEKHEAALVRPADQAKAGRCNASGCVNDVDVRCWRWKGHGGIHRGGNRFYGSTRVMWA